MSRKSRISFEIKIKYVQEYFTGKKHYVMYVKS